MKLHGLKVSGHVHRVELLLRMLGLPYEFIPAPADVRAGSDFRTRLNLYGQIPVLEDGELVLQDSNAILVYLCKRYAPGGSWLPEDPQGAAAVQRWLSVAAGEIAFGPANARAHTLWGAPGHKPTASAVAERLLGFMEAHLATRGYLAAGHPTIADLACYSYIAVAPEGGVSLDSFPAVRAWLGRVEALAGFVAIPRSA